MSESDAPAPIGVRRAISYALQEFRRGMGVEALHFT